MVLSNKDINTTAIVDSNIDDERRDVQRRSVLWQAILHIGSHEFDCQIRNFSMGGLKLNLDLPFKEGTALRIEIPMRDITLNGEISWQADGHIGIRFHEEEDLIKGVFGDRASGMGIKKQSYFRHYKKSVA